MSRAAQRSAQAGNRETAAIGVAPDVVVEAVLTDKGRELAAETTLSTILWQQDHERYISLSLQLDMDSLSVSPLQIGFLLEFVQIDLRIIHGDKVQWTTVEGAPGDAEDYSDGGGGNLGDRADDGNSNADSDADGDANARAGNAAAGPTTASGTASPGTLPPPPPPPSSGYVALPLHRVVVLEEGPYSDFENLAKQVEFRHGNITSVTPGMSLPIALSLALRRVGRTGLLLAEVADVLHCSAEEAYRRFPTDAHRCNLWMRCAGRNSRTVTCIVVRNVRPALEFSFLVPGNLGFLHQFSLETGTPQFCLTSDLGKTVNVVLASRSGRTAQTVQRTLMMSASARINDAAAHGGSAASPRAYGSDAAGRGSSMSEGQTHVISLLDSPGNAGASSVVDLTAGRPGHLYTTPWHPFATFLNGSAVAGASYMTVHEFVEASLNTLLEGVSHADRKAICEATMGRLLESDELSDALPARPNILSLS